MQCVYCQGAKSKKISREHLISHSVLEVAFGSKIQNVVRSELFGDKTLRNHEPMVKDVCIHCNNEMLRPYDIAGVNLAREVCTSFDGLGKEITFDFNTIIWLLKTHLNHVRIIPERGTKKYYPISQKIYDGISRRKGETLDLFKIAVVGWRGLPYFWDESDPRRIQYFSYTSVCFPHQRVLVSDFRMKWLHTFILIPSDSDYENFEQRANLTIDAMKNSYSIDAEIIDLKAATRNGFLKVSKIMDKETILKFVKKLENTQLLNC